METEILAKRLAHAEESVVAPEDRGLIVLHLVSSQIPGGPFARIHGLLSAQAVPVWIILIFQ
ncbi:hypothetical protein ACFSTI_28725 [Rhizorhabdus histidinilytica]